MRKFDRTRPIKRCQNVGHAANRPPEACGVAFGRGISAKLRDFALSHIELCCEMCGAACGDIDDLTRRKVEFHVGKIKAKKLGGRDEASNLRVLCSTCFRGAKELYRFRTSGNWRLSQVSQTGQGAQRPVFSQLIREIA